MNRREFLQSLAIAASASRSLKADPVPAWRTFEVTTRVEVLKSSGPVQVWLPVPLTTPTPFQRSLSNTMQAPGARATLRKRTKVSPAIVHAIFPAGVTPVLNLTSLVATRDYTVNLSSPGSRPRAHQAELRQFLQPTKLLPLDGIVKSTALEITADAPADLDKARAIYNWIVENTRRNPQTRGCGLGNIRYMLESKDLSGKCADLNALFVGLARAAGLPARDLYGIRIAKSNLGYTSLGTSSNKISKSQHCRAQVYLADYGWVPVDPADVRKVILEEPPAHRPLNDPLVQTARARLFGSWEMNWIAYNDAPDVVLPGSSGPPLGFLMYPQAETAEGRLDCLNPESFHYEITSRELSAHAI